MERQQFRRAWGARERISQRFQQRDTVHLARVCIDGRCTYRGFMSGSLMRSEMGNYLVKVYNTWRPTINENDQLEVSLAAALYNSLDAASRTGTSMMPAVDAFNEWADHVNKEMHMTVLTDVSLMEELNVGRGIGRSIYIPEMSDDYDLTDDVDAYNTRKGAEIAVIDWFDENSRDIEDFIRKSCDYNQVQNAFRELMIAIGEDNYNKAISAWSTIIVRCEEARDKYEVRIYEAELVT